MYSSNLIPTAHGITSSPISHDTELSYKVTIHHKCNIRLRLTYQCVTIYCILSTEITFNSLSSRINSSTYKSGDSRSSSTKFVLHDIVIFCFCVSFYFSSFIYTLSLFVLKCVISLFVVILNVLYSVWLFVIKYDCAISSRDCTRGFFTRILSILSPLVCTLCKNYGTMQEYFCKFKENCI